jgi:hypothetical protein
VSSSPSSSFEPAVATLQQRPREPTLQQYLAHAHGHNTRCTAAANAAGGSPQPQDLAAMVPQLPLSPRPQGGPPPPQGRRKIGRPIAFTGDPDSTKLTDAERRRLKRWLCHLTSLLLGSMVARIWEDVCQKGALCS